MTSEQIFAQMQMAMRILAQQNKKLQQRLVVSEASAALGRAGREPTMRIDACAQFAEDVFLWELFEGKTSGFFVEAGAFDGFNYSVSYLFEAVGWRGLLVEAIPDRYQQCLARRKNSRVVHAALSRRGASGEVQLNVTRDPLGGMYSFVDGTSDPSTMRHELNTMGVSASKVSVPATTLSDLLAEHDGSIDFAMIDVEGAEPDVIDGFDLPRLRPRVLLVEDNTLGRHPALDAAMRDTPYVDAGWVHPNRIFIRDDEADLLTRARALTALW
jgi:FkbM family methyltransferase